MAGRFSEFQLSLLISAATVIAYFSTVQNGFVDYDDDLYVTKNTYVRQGLTAESVLYAFVSVNTANYTPVTMLAYEVQVALFGVEPWVMHATSLGFHLANSLLLFRFLRLMTNALYRSALVALLFAVHPLHVESVAWVSELKDVLSTFFLLLVLFTYHRYCQRPTWKNYLLMLGLFALGLLSKSMLVTTPLLLCIMDVWMLNRRETADVNAIQATESEPVQQRTAADAVVPARSTRKSLNGLLREKLPFFLLSFLIGVITILAQIATSSMETFEILPLEYRVGNLLNSYGWYLVKTAYPLGLSVFYPHPHKTLHLSAVVQGASLICAISLWVWWGSRDRKILAFGWLWFLVALLPVIGLVQVGKQAYADRYSYVPHIGLFAMIVWEGHFWLIRLPKPWLWGWGLTVPAVLSLMVLTSHQVTCWKNTETLWTQAMAVDATNYAAYRGLGNVLRNQGKLHESLSMLETALKLKPDNQNIHNDLGCTLWALGEDLRAEGCFLRTIELDPLNYPANHNLVSFYRQQKRYKQAIFCARKFAENAPHSPIPQLMLAQIFQESGALEEEEQAIEQVLRLRPNDDYMRHALEELRKIRNSSPQPDGK